MILLLLTAFILGAGGAWLIKLYGIAFGFSDLPTSRSSHAVPTPKGGGIGILAAFLFAALCLRLDPVFIMTVFIVSLSGFIDDRFDLSAGLKLVLHILAASVIVLKYGNLTSPVWSSVAWIIFIVGTANFFNFMDGIDGIASLTAIAAFLLMGCYLFLTGRLNGYLWTGLSVGIACIGFLPYNLAKTKVFMGDTGSILTGFLYGVMIYLFSDNVKDFLILASFIFPFYCDEMLTMLLRIKEKENLFLAHRKHLYQILANEAGIAHISVSFLYFFVQVFIGGTMIMIYRKNIVYQIMLLLLFLLLFAFFSFVVRKRYNAVF